MTFVITFVTLVGALGARRHLVGPRRGTPSTGAVAPIAAPATTPDDAAWAALLDAMAGEIRAGSSLRVAFTVAVHRFRPKGRALAPTTVLDEVLTLTSPDPAEAVVLQTVSVAATLGGPTASVLESGAALLRERAAVAAEAAAHAAQARLSARVLTAVPLVFAAWSAAASASFRAALFSGAGSLAAGAGVACNVIGWWWMRAIVDRAHR